MNYDEFVTIIDESEDFQDIIYRVLQDNKDTIKIKKETTAIKNFEKIFDAVFKITYEKGFHCMTMRDLSSETQLSMGALYSYFQSKEELLTIIQRQGRSMIVKVLDFFSSKHDNPLEKLTAVIKAHLFLSEKEKPWFYFNFMEAKNLSDSERDAILETEAYTEQILIDILEQGEKQGLFSPRKHVLTSSIIKAMQQEWYLKRWKYAKRGISVDEYAEYVLEFVRSFCLVDNR